MSPSVQKFSIECPQDRMVMIPFDLVSGVLSTGKFDGVLSSGGTGVYTITFNEPFVNAPEAVATCTTDNRFARISASTAFLITVEVQDIAGGASADGDFGVLVCGNNATPIAQG